MKHLTASSTWYVTDYINWIGEKLLMEKEEKLQLCNLFMNRVNMAKKLWFCQSSRRSENRRKVSISINLHFNLSWISLTTTRIKAAFSAILISFAPNNLISFDRVVYSKHFAISAAACELCKLSFIYFSCTTNREHRAVWV